MGNIYAAITGVMNEISPITKSKMNVQQGFMYRSVDAVMNELQPLLAKHRVFIVPEVLESSRHDRPSKNGGVLFCVVQKIKFTFYAEDGTSVFAIVEGEAMDSADKGTNKALSVAFKYACFQVFCIPTDEQKDPDADSPTPAARTSQPAKQEHHTERAPEHQAPRPSDDGSSIDFGETITRAVSAGKVSEKDAAMWRERLSKDQTRHVAESWIRANLKDYLVTMKSAEKVDIAEEAMAAVTTDLDTAADEGFKPQPEELDVF